MEQKMENGTLYNMEMWRVASRVPRPSSQPRVRKTKVHWPRYPDSMHIHNYKARKALPYINSTINDTDLFKRADSRLEVMACYHLLTPPPS